MLVRPPTDTDTSVLINQLDLDSIYTRRLVQQATMFFKNHYNLVDICHLSYIQHANHTSSRTDHPLNFCNKNTLRINAYEYFLSLIVDIWNLFPCSAVSHVTPSVDDFHKFAISAMKVMQPLYGAALIYVSYDYFLPIATIAFYLHVIFTFSLS